MKKIREIYSYLENSSRGKIIFDLVKDKVKPNDIILDVNCGVAPVTRYFTSNKVIGFDSDEEMYLEANKYIECHKMSDSVWCKVNFIKVDIMFFLGLSGGYSSSGLESNYECNFIIEYLEKHYPKIIFLEGSQEYHQGQMLENPIKIIEKNYNITRTEFVVPDGEFLANKRILITGVRKEE